MAAPAFTASAFCSFAKTLRLRWDTDETSIRTSMSRAYYGAFLEARDAKNLSSSGSNGHQVVISAYFGTGQPVDKAISSSLRKLKGLREKADYEPHAACSKLDAQDAITEAEKVLRALRVMSPKLPDLVPFQIPGTPRTP